MSRSLGFYTFSVVVFSFWLLALPSLSDAQNASVCPFTWTRTLKVGTNGSDVLKLQQFLNVSPQTGYYGSITAKAVSKFQEEYASSILTPNGLTTGTGIVGVSTRTELNSLCVSTQTSMVPTPSVLGASTETPSLTVTAGEQPPHSIVPANALYVPFTNVTFTAGSQDVNISQVTAKRVGVGDNSAFYDIGLVDPTGVEDAYGFPNVNNDAVIKYSFTIPAGTSQTYTLVGDMNSDLSQSDGEMPAIALEAIEASVPVSGNLPIVGTAQTINNELIIGSGTVTLSSDDPGGAQTKYINDTDVRFSGIHITANSAEDLTLGSITWEQTGSAGSGDITNVATVVNGVSYPATSPDGRWYTSTFSPEIVIKKGDSVDAVIQGDLTSTGANRTVEFDLFQGSYVYLVGNTYGFAVPLYPGGNTATSGNDVFLTSDGTTDGTSLTPFLAGSITTISAGAFSGIESNN